MTQSTSSTTSTTTSMPTMYPVLRYRDMRAAIDLLERAFGFERHAVYEEKDGSIGHSELRFGNGMVMLGPARDDGRGMKTPAELGGQMWGPYVVVDDPDAHYARAKAAGATIVDDLRNEDYGSRGYSVRDAEGYVWSFGTYQPQATPQA